MASCNALIWPLLSLTTCNLSLGVFPDLDESLELLDPEACDYANRYSWNTLTDFGFANIFHSRKFQIIIFVPENGRVFDPTSNEGWLLRPRFLPRIILRRCCYRWPDGRVVCVARLVDHGRPPQRWRCLFGEEDHKNAQLIIVTKSVFL